MKYGEEFKLCYVEGSRAFFTTLDLDEQNGDDWNDAPYEHNAGRPYTYSPQVWNRSLAAHEPNPNPPYQVAHVMFDAYLQTPADRANGNSVYSVDDINERLVPWLASPRDANGPRVKIWSGTSYPEFVRLVQSAGGTVYEPLDDQEPTP